MIMRMQIDPRLNEIDDCLYRVAARALIVQGDRVLLVKESTDDWWALPGGGVDHGESIESALVREIQEELGVPAEAVSSKMTIAYYEIGNVVNGVPRMNLYFKVYLPEESLGTSNHIAQWQWFNKVEFLSSHLHSSYNKQKLVGIIFND